MKRIGKILKAPALRPTQKCKLIYGLQEASFRELSKVTLGQGGGVVKGEAESPEDAIKKLARKFLRKPTRND